MEFIVFKDFVFCFFYLFRIIGIFDDIVGLVNVRLEGGCIFYGQSFDRILNLYYQTVYYLIKEKKLVFSIFIDTLVINFVYLFFYYIILLVYLLVVCS